MSKLGTIRANSTWGQILEGQPQHVGIAILMTAGAISFLSCADDAPKLLGLTSAQWAATSIGLAVIHQVIVAFVFRLQLHRNLMNRLFGDSAMRVWAAIFMPLLIARPLTVFMAGWADPVAITTYRWAEIGLGLALLAPSVWALYSVIVYFTLPRALGGDHFRDTYVDMPMVNKGAFAFTGNAMYGLAFLGLWAIALLFGSWNALIVALFQQSYIWVHMYCTEAPDMRRIYSTDDA